MPKKLPSYIASTVVVLALLSQFGHTVQQVHSGKSKLPGGVQNVVRDFVGVVNLFERAVEESQSLPKTFVKTPKHFEAINRLEEDVKILTSYHNEANTRTVALINLRTGEELKTWEFTKLTNPSNRVMHSIMLPDSGLICAVHGVSGVYRLNSEGDILWYQDSVYHHHAINLGNDGSAWVNSVTPDKTQYFLYNGRLEMGNKSYPYVDHSITRLDLETGRILYNRSLTDVLVKHDLTHLLVKSTVTRTPLHTNDVQPALSDGPYWNRGDVFISSRNGSWIMQFRPSTDEVIRVIEGPFSNQHDVDFESDSTIIFFNNGSPTQPLGKKDGWPTTSDPVDIRFHSGILRYHLGSGEFEHVERDAFRDYDIYTHTEGLQDAIPGGGYLVEEQNASVLWVIRDGEVLYKNVLKSHHPGHHHLANWARVIE